MINNRRDRMSIGVNAIEKKKVKKGVEKYMRV